MAGQETKMHVIVKAFGWLQVIVGIAVGVFGIRLFLETTAPGLWLLGTAGGFILSGALFWCFGAIVGHLRAIRTALENRAP